MTRIEILKREDMNAAQGEVYDEAQANGGPVGGPYYAYIRIPELMRRSQNLRACLHSGPLSGRERQIINLVVARHWGAKYPWFAQARGALAVGLEQEIIDAINVNETPQLGDPREQAVYTLARELLAERFLSDATYAAAEASLGLEDLVAAVANVGQFGMTCCTANAFEIDPPDDAPIPLADL
ncbi:MAG: carboxymuconolactone decarboxylase family protein [Alphaproteobacteria bacterium]|nr:carboxymuconolactone decarboxylase family protein [Alphaproteobacteria bacterium]